MTKTYDNAIRTGKEFLGQVVTNVYTGKTTYSVATGANGQTGTYLAVLDVSITPTASNSKIRVELNLSYEVSENLVLRLYRSVGGVETEIVRNDDTNYWSGWGLVPYDANHSSTGATTHYIYVDSPNTTSTITYRFAAQSTGASRTFALNRTLNSTGQSNYENAVSQAILTEILVV